jgi:transcriptional regulator with XRE-family HTH domain
LAKHKLIESKELRRNMKRRSKMSLLREYMQDEQFKKLMAQEDLIMEVTEFLCYLMEREGVSRTELAERLGKSKGFVSQILNGGRNLTLRTLADIAEVLGYKISLLPHKKLKFQNREIKILEFQNEKWFDTLEKSSFLQNWEIPYLKVAA